MWLWSIQTVVDIYRPAFIADYQPSSFHHKTIPTLNEYMLLLKVGIVLSKKEWLVISWPRIIGTLYQRIAM